MSDLLKTAAWVLACLTAAVLFGWLAEEADCPEACWLSCAVCLAAATDRPKALPLPTFKL